MTYRKKIEIQAKEWTDRTYGNSYFSSRITIDDKVVRVTEMDSGYGEAYLHNAMQWLRDEGHIPAKMRFATEGKDFGIAMFYNIETGCRKREVEDYGRA